MPKTARYKKRFKRVEDRFKTLSLKSQKKEALSKFQRYIKLKNLTPEGTLICVTCNIELPLGLKINAGHYISRSRNSTCFHENNAHPQCVRCNRNLNGNLAEYRRFMVKEYGEEKVVELENLSKEKKKFTREELVKLYLKFEGKCKEYELIKDGANAS